VLLRYFASVFILVQGGQITAHWLYAACHLLYVACKTMWSMHIKWTMETLLTKNEP